MDRIIENWRGLIEIEEELSSSNCEWIFRGQSSSKQKLKTTLERAFEDFNIKSAHMSQIEKRIFNDFRRASHLYTSEYKLDRSDTISWLALMRHYGAPNRLLDFTYSLFIACYFAIEFSTDTSAVWAINKTWLSKNMKKKLEPYNDKNYWEAWFKRDGWVFDELFFDGHSDLNIVAPVNPMVMNDRLLVQKGLFLCPSDINKPFQKSIDELEDSQGNIIKLNIDSSVKESILERLQRVGINRATLFPGLEGYSSSLRTKILDFRKIEELQDSGGRLRTPRGGV